MLNQPERIHVNNKSLKEVTMNKSCIIKRMKQHMCRCVFSILYTSLGILFLYQMF